jgi:hypothetical protein
MFDAFMLAFDANRVIGLRIARLMLGGKRSQREAKLMVTEKMAAAVEAAGKLMAGASSDDLVYLYRRRVASNARRLSGLTRPVQAAPTQVNCKSASWDGKNSGCSRRVPDRNPGYAGMHWASYDRGADKMRGGHPRRQSQWRANASRRRRASCPQASNSRPGMALPALREVSGGKPI